MVKAALAEGLLEDLTHIQLQSSCFYETKELYGATVDEGVYKTDLTLLTADAYTKQNSVVPQFVDGFHPDYQVKSFKMCSQNDTLVGIQLQLGVPTYDNDESFDGLFVLYGYGLYRKDEQNCSYMELSAGEYIKEMTLT